MIVRVRAKWVVPVAAPVLPGGWIDVDDERGEITAIGDSRTRSARRADRVVDLPDAAILPGLVNAHTHLELSHLAGAVPPAASFVTWVRTMLAARAATPAAVSTITDAIVRAIAAMEATGTAGIGDIGNTDLAVLPLAGSLLSGVHFREALGFRGAVARRVAAEARLGAAVAQAQLVEHGCARIVSSVAPHAPYSTSAALMQDLARGTREAHRVSSLHLAESGEEVEFLQTGRGAFRELLADLGVWDETWTPPGVRPVEYVRGLGVLHDRLLVVHGTQLAADQLRAIADARATLVLCVRSNRWVGAGAPPAEEAFASGARIALGTDSLASVEDLNLFAELAALRRLTPGIPPGRLLRAATWGGAQALGCTALGYLGPGATSRAVVRTPAAHVEDVEEWLAADAADTADLRWLDDVVTRASA